MGQKAHNNPNTGSYCKDYMIVLQGKIFKKRNFCYKRSSRPYKE